MKLPNNKLRFILLNNISPDNAKQSVYLIYAHECSEGIYVGLSKDPVKRWQEHFSDAFNKNSQYYNDNLKAAIRKCQNNFKHYIIATAAFEKAARNREAAAIAFYSDRLNTKIEINHSDENFNFSPIHNQISRVLIIDKRGSNSKGNRPSIDSSQRKKAFFEVYFGLNRKRMRTIAGQNDFPPNLNLQYSKDDRNEFNIGDIVSINVIIAERAGTQYCVPATDDVLVLVKK